jgi:plasmid stabilization system protein ParE
MASYGFHPDALLEYAEATTYYLHEASPEVAERFVATVESGLSALLSAPDRWRIVEEPGIRRYVFSRFPYVLYYRWEAARDRIAVYAIMHSSREPGYWKDRIVS